MMDHLTLSSIQNGSDFNYDIILQQRKCIICKQFYTESENIGSWKCHMHPGNIEHGRWTCCDQPVSRIVSDINSFYMSLPRPSQQGCIRADHRLVYSAFLPTDSLVIPRYQLKSFKGILQAACQRILSPNAPPIIVVWRYCSF